ncbi:putative Beta-glucosidase [Quillaja saponaria]|uniref:Beta-glucosidase n=1 Tax=Quillaja saponaria TaxID=32244 RepID=A0AAD7Q155_QUISA|nr:putative Beta-glucosidase [Quillaja saponaria]
MQPGTFLSLSCLLISLLHLSTGVSSVNEFSRDDFPPGFVFGSGTSAYQVEGAANEDGRTPSIWDTFAHAVYAHEHNVDVAADEYHKYKEDVQLMVETGLDAYKFSISWSRLIPNGRGPVNPKGLQYYNNLINELIRHGIQPHVTMNHFDHPQALEDEYGGWVSRNIIRDFTAYADVCFREFGDRVLYWTTVNEPNVFALGGYDSGEEPPQRCSPPFGVVNCSKGNSTSEPYLVVHHILLAHASAVNLYRKQYKDKQHGFVGLSIYTMGLLPETDTKEDIIASQRVHDFYVGWIMDPLVYGDYPKIMKKNVGSRIPSFTNLESKQVKGSFDFLGVIYYLNVNVKDNPESLKMKQRDPQTDVAAKITFSADLSSDDELPITPWALQGVLEKFKQQYGNPPIFVFENGQRTKRNSSLEDFGRLTYLHGNIGGVLDALRNGSNTRGYLQWSFIDVFELLSGYASSYGLYYVDLDDPDLKRYPKLSAHWYSRFLKGGSISGVGPIELEKNLSALSAAHLFH